MKILVTITTGFTLVGGLASVMMNYYRVLTKTNLNIDFLLFQRTTTSTS